MCIRDSYKPIKVKFLDENYRQYNGKYLMLNIANTRQFGNNAYIAPKASKSDGLVAVSYTHLDVYKRQVPTVAT